MKKQPDPKLKETETVPADPLPEDPGKTAAAAVAKIRRRRMRAFRSFVVRLVSLAAVVYVLFFHIVGIAFMPSRDMYPRLDAGDLLLFYRLEKSPKAQDIAVIDKNVNGEKKRFVCRVIATPGDTVEVREQGGLRVNGNTQAESNIFYSTQPYEGHVEYPLKLGDGEYFVMADQRSGGMDSRYYGPVSAEEIQGVVITVLRRNNL